MKTNYKIEISRIKFWLLLLPMLLLFVALLGVGAYFLVDKVVMPKVTGVTNKGEVTVPMIIDLPLEEARNLCYDRGLRVTESSSEYSDTAAVGQVLTQEPEEGALVKTGRHISVIVSKGAEVDTIPSISGLMQGPAKSKLREAGFSNVTVRSIYSNSIDQNMCISTEPNRNTITSREARIVLYLSKGARPTHAMVPNMVGDRLSAARSALDAAGLQAGTISYETSSIMGPGQVISQSSSGGSRITIDSRVNLVISKQ